MKKHALQSSSELSFSGKQWRFAAATPSTSTQPQSSSTTSSLSPLLVTLLKQRNIIDHERFLRAALKDLPDPNEMADMPLAVQRIILAITEQEPIIVYGDYDVDGVCSTSLLVEFLRAVGAVVDYYIPDRREEGYGLNSQAVRNIAVKTKLLITTDCGITSFEEVTVANSVGLDVIIVDHHTVPEQLPPAVAVLNPHRKECAYADKNLCAAGVAFMLLGALRKEMRSQGFFAQGKLKEPDIKQQLDLAAVATVADMVPLTGVNRILVCAGLRQLPHTKRIGMQELMAISQVDPCRISAQDIGFRIGPRINARGRLKHAGAGVELFLTDDRDRAKLLAKELDRVNLERRELEKTTVAAAAAIVKDQQLDQNSGIVIYNKNWHPGVLGLVSSRLVSQFSRPTIAIGDGGKGSGRTFETLNLFAAMQAAEQWTERFGGHKAAAGLTIKIENIDAFRNEFLTAVHKELGDPPYIPTITIDHELTEDQLTLAQANELQHLAPYGQGHLEPYFLCRNMVMGQRRIVGDNHLKLRLGAINIDAIAFGMGELIDTLPSAVDVVFILESNFFRGRTTPQLRVVDMRQPTA